MMTGNKAIPSEKCQRIFKSSWGNNMNTLSYKGYTAEIAVAAVKEGKNLNKWVIDTPTRVVHAH